MSNILKNKFKIIIPAFRCSKWLRKNLSMIEKQSYPHYEVCIIDDASGELEQLRIIREFSERCGWKAIYNSEKKGALCNIVRGIREFQCSDDDVIVIVDGDDWLFDRNVLRFLDILYASEDIALTYGQMVWLSRSEALCERLTPETIEQKTYRKLKWCFSHPRTYKYFLWRHIREEDLKDPEGNYFQAAQDMAVMYPMLEMAGNHSRFIPELLYIYNDRNPLCNFRVRTEEQSRNADYIRKKKPYELLLTDAPKKIVRPFPVKMELAWLQAFFRVKAYLCFPLLFARELKRRLEKVLKA